ncbi:MAG: molybdopterin-dependent oxidoreductase [Deltaproteobacteria bacterium]|nr:molybdopterin-dependent oxidoreductase [Deltaproteobacteria bacterium]
MKRRDFLKFIGVGGVGTGLGFVLGKVSKPPGAKLIPYLIPPEDIVPGVANWYASACTQCSAGCGVLVRVMEGRAKKIEGNPQHPVSKGKVCARGQSSLQALYNPDRIKKPLKRRGERGSGDFTEITWEEAIKTLSQNLTELKSKGEADKVHLVSSPVRGHLNTLINNFMAAYGSPNYMQYELFQNRNLLYANQISMGINTIPYYNIENTKYLLSFGADFSSTWASPVNYSNGYGQMRQGPGARGKLVQVEPRLSLTGANADQWVPAKPGTEALLALSIAHTMIEKGYAKGDAGAWRGVLSKYRAKDIAPICDVTEARIEEIAKEFGQTRPSLAIGGDTLASYENGVSGLVAVNILNQVAGNIGISGGVIPNPEDFTGGRKLDFNKKISTLAANAAQSKIKTLLIYDVNPVFTTPVAAKLTESLSKIPFIASFSSFMDETTAMADLVLPSHTSLEDWGDDFPEPGVGAPVATIIQPVVSPVFDTKGLGDIFIELAKGIGGNVAAKINAPSAAEYLKASWKELYSRNKEMSAKTLGFEEFWNKALQNGGWWGAERKRSASVSARAAEYLSSTPAKFEGEENQYPFYMIPYATAAYLDGRGANIPWLQELPDPMTSVVWGSWVEINPKTAASLGLKEGDLVNIESPFGKISAPVYLYPGIRPDTIGVPIGQGHNHYGRYAKGRGVNPIDILPFKENPKSGEIALNSTRVRITKGSSGERLVKMEGSTKELGRGIAQTVTIDEFKRMKKEVV